MTGVGFTFHSVTYRTVKELKDGCNTIALNFAARAEATDWDLSAAGKILHQAIQDLTLAIGEGQSFKEIGDRQEQYRTALQEFEGLHKKWVTQSTSALSVFRDYWSKEQSHG